jgi:chemotaxis protein methyltransferase CheR
LRIWSAACATGQEPYSLAMMLKDHFPVLGGWKVEIVATDLSPTVLERAREGVYSTFEVQRGLPIQMLIRHFDQQDSNWKIKPELRQSITFRALNLLEDFAVLGQFDVVLCRNVLIYFDQPTKTRILAAIARRIVPDGVLLLGGAESVFGLSDAFAGIAGLKGVYGHADRIKPAPVVRPSLQLPAAS